MFICMVINDALQLTLVTALYVISYIFRKIHASVCCLLVNHSSISQAHHICFACFHVLSLRDPDYRPSNTEERKIVLHLYRICMNTVIVALKSTIGSKEDDLHSTMRDLQINYYTPLLSFVLSLHPPLPSLDHDSDPHHPLHPSHPGRHGCGALHLHLFPSALQPDV